jgi:NAD(P)-dependent dehydrogenase (short-subunit alcohol dehydrogenase family)
MASIEVGPTTGVVVTGGASGIGRATGAALAEAGRAVALWDLSEERASEAAAVIAAEYGVAAAGFGVDVRATSTLPDAVRRSVAVIGPVGGLVHAAGVPDPIELADLTDEAWDALFAVNLRAYAMIAQALLPELLANAPGSAIVGISSIHGIVAGTRDPAYAASKAGVLGLTRSLGLRYGKEGVRANAICPGYIDTPMLPQHQAIRDWMTTRTPIGRLGRPAEIARVARFLLSDDASFVNGTQVVVDGGVLATDG